MLILWIRLPRECLKCGWWYPNLLLLGVSAGDIMTGLRLVREASSSVKGYVEAGCSGHLGDPALVSQIPIRFPGENPSASLGTRSVSPLVTAGWVGERQQHRCLRSSSHWPLPGLDKPVQTQGYGGLLPDPHWLGQKCEVRHLEITCGPVGVPGFLKLCHQCVLQPWNCQGKQNSFHKKNEIEDLSLLGFGGWSFFSHDNPSTYYFIWEGFCISVLDFYIHILKANKCLPNLDTWPCNTSGVFGGKE